LDWITILVAVVVVAGVEAEEVLYFLFLKI
jgi:hypothetical protein